MIRGKIHVPREKLGNCTTIVLMDCQLKSEYKGGGCLTVNHSQYLVLPSWEARMVADVFKHIQIIGISASATGT